MDRRETIKTLLVGGMAGTVALTTGCEAPETQEKVSETPTEKLYGRTPEEKLVDEKLLAQKSAFTTDNLATIAIICDIILPATATSGSATEAGVTEFIDFMVKDIPNYELPLKGGLMWLDREANLRFNKVFKDLDSNLQLEIIDDIAYPEEAAEVMKPGVNFFNRIRDLTLTGYYTSKLGIADLGYKGNQPNVWDGVPEDVLAQHEVDYDPEWLAKCVDQSKRTDIAEWDDQGNLLT